MNQIRFAIPVGDFTNLLPAPFGRVFVGHTSIAVYAFQKARPFQRMPNVECEGFEVVIVPLELQSPGVAIIGERLYEMAIRFPAIQRWHLR